MTEQTVDQKKTTTRREAAPVRSTDEVVTALLVVLDGALAGAEDRRAVLAAAVEVAALEPTAADLAAARAEAHAEHDSLVRVLTALPGQRSATGNPLVAAATTTRDLRLEVLDLVGVGGLPQQR